MGPAPLGGPGPSPAPRDVLDGLAAPRPRQQACAPGDRPTLPNEVQCPGDRELGLVSDGSFYQETQTSLSLHVAGVFPLDARFPGALRSRARPLFLKTVSAPAPCCPRPGLRPRSCARPGPPALGALRSLLRLIPAARRVPALGTPVSSESLRPAASLPPRLPRRPCTTVLPFGGAPGFGLASLGFRACPDGQAPGREPPGPSTAPGDTARLVRRGRAGPLQGRVRRIPKPARVFGMSGPRSGDSAHALQHLLHGWWSGSSPRHAHV